MRKYHNFIFMIHNVKVFVKLSVFSLFALFMLQIIVCVGLVDLFLLDKYGWMVMFKFVGAKIASSINPDYPIQITNPDGTTIGTTAQAIYDNGSINQMANWVFHEAKDYFLRTAPVYALYPIGLIVICMFKLPEKRKDHIRGTKLATKNEFFGEARKRNDHLDLSIGDISMPRSCTEKSSMVVGKPGVGKTVMTSSIFSTLKEHRVRMVVYDFKGDYIERFHNPSTDIIFNPFDERGIDWNIFNEISGPLDIDAIAASLIPSLEGTTADPFWSDGARDVISSILHFLWHGNLRRNSEIWKMVSKDGKQLTGDLKKTKASGAKKGYKYIVEHKSKQTLSILSVVMQYASCFEYMKNGSSDFSISSWIEKGTGNIFISNNASVQDSLKPILSLFLDLIIRKTLSMPDDTIPKTVFLLDEFTSLQKLPSMVKLLTLGRSKRASAFLGTQSYAQVEDIYGKAAKESIINSCGNQILFSVAGSESAKEASALLGDFESIRQEASVSTGSDYREGASLAYRTSTDPLVLPSEIMGLADLEFIAKLSDYAPVKSKLEYTIYPKVDQGFVMRPDLVFSDKNVKNRKVRTRKNSGNR